MTPVFISTASALAGNPLPVIVSDADGNPVDSASVVWSGLGASVTVAADPDVPGRFVFNSTAVATVSAKATVGAASATIVLSFTGLKFQKG